MAKVKVDDASSYLGIDSSSMVILSADDGVHYLVDSDEDLHYALSLSETDAKDSVIHIAQGIYQGDFSYYGGGILDYYDEGLTLLGGYDTTFTSRSTDPSLTIFDGVNSASSITIDATYNTKAITIDGFTFQNSNISSFEAMGASLGIVTTGGVITINNNVFQNNTIDGKGGSVAITSSSNSGQSLIFTNNTLNNNIQVESSNAGSFGSGGGALLVYRTKDVLIENNSFEGNTAGGAGGALWLRDSTNVAIQNNIFDGNKSELGGAMYVLANRGSITLENNQITNNDAYWSGGVNLISTDGNIYVRDNIISNNTATEKDGAIFSSTSSGAAYEQVYSGNVIESNSSHQGSGAIYIDASSDNKIQINNNLISSNSLNAPSELYDNYGGGIKVWYQFGGELELINNTIVNNHSDGTGGGVDIQNRRGGSEWDISNNVFYGNTNDGTEDGGTKLGSDISINSDLKDFTLNLESNVFDPNLLGFGVHSGSNVHTYEIPSSNIDSTVVTPLFVDAANGDYRLSSDSPLINQGVVTTNVASADLDGNTRVAGSAVDIGAYEYQNNVIFNMNGDSDAGISWSFTQSSNDLFQVVKTYANTENSNIREYVYYADGSLLRFTFAEGNHNYIYEYNNNGVLARYIKHDTDDTIYTSTYDYINDTHVTTDKFLDENGQVRKTILKTRVESLDYDGDVIHYVKQRLDENDTVYVSTTEAKTATGYIETRDNGELFKVNTRTFNENGNRTSQVESFYNEGGDNAINRKEVKTYNEDGSSSKVRYDYEYEVRDGHAITWEWHDELNEAGKAIEIGISDDYVIETRLYETNNLGGETATYTHTHHTDSIRHPLSPNQPDYISTEIKVYDANNDLVARTNIKEYTAGHVVTKVTTYYDDGSNTWQSTETNIDGTINSISNGDADGNIFIVGYADDSSIKWSMYKTPASDVANETRIYKDASGNIYRETYITHEQGVDKNGNEVTIYSEVDKTTDEVRLHENNNGSEQFLGAVHQTHQHRWYKEYSVWDNAEKMFVSESYDEYGDTIYTYTNNFGYADVVSHSLTHTALADVITTLQGADAVYALAGDDIINLTVSSIWGSGYAAKNVGNEISVGTNQKIGLSNLNQFSDVIDGGIGVDAINLTNGNDAFFIDDVYSGHHNSLTNSLGDTIQGVKSSARVVDIEVINAGDGNDVVDLTSINYILTHAVTINGESGNDILWGSNGDDVIDGGAGNDVIFDGAGSGRLTGGTGGDTFQFTATSDSNVITDFNMTESDGIELHYRGEDASDYNSLVVSGNSFMSLLTWNSGEGEKVEIYLDNVNIDNHQIEDIIIFVEIV